MTKRLPERRCVICRRSSAKRSLARVVVVEGALALDREQRLPGRGAYIHPAPQCASRAGDKKRWLQAFRLDEQAVSDESVQAVTRELFDLSRTLDCDEEKRHDVASLRGQKRERRIGGKEGKIRL